MGRTRQPGEAPSAAARPVDPRISALLEEVRTTRLRLAADLSAAAGAVEDDRRDIARDIVTAELADVAAFRATAIARLEDEDSPAPQPRTRSRHSRALLALPAVPLIGGLAMTAAAALSSGGAPATHQHHRAGTSVIAAAPQPTHAALRLAAHSTLRRLEHVVEDHGGAAQVIAVATDLHQELTQIITLSSNNPLQLNVVKRLLAAEQHVLEVNKTPGATVALAASQQVVDLFNKSAAPIVGALHQTPYVAPPNAASKSKPHHSTSTTHHHRKNAARPKQTTTTPSPKPTPSIPLLYGGGIGGVL